MGVRKGMAIAAIIEQYSLGNGSCVVFFDDDAAYLQGVIEYVTRVNLTQVRVRAACARDTRARLRARVRCLLAGVSYALTQGCSRFVPVTSAPQVRVWCGNAAKCSWVQGLAGSADAGGFRAADVQRAVKSCGYQPSLTTEQEHLN